MGKLSELKEKFNNMDMESKKRLIIYGGGAIGVLILIIIISIVVAIITRKTPYDKVEEIMANAAYKYYKDNPGSLPTADVKTATVNVDTLVSGEYMKELKKYTKNDSCTGNVVVTNLGDDYDYQAYVTCNDFKTELLVDVIKNNNPVVSLKDGLYNEDGVLRFRGEYVKNYLKVGETVYRILKIDTSNKIYLIAEATDDDDEDLYVYWDDRYNTEEDSMCGINDYSLSRIKRSLESYYKNLEPTLKNSTTTFNACYGNRSLDDTNNSGQTECSRVIDNANIALLPIYDYIKASIAPACQKASSQECRNYNYLVNNDSSWWTNTGNAGDTTSIYYITSSGEIDKDRGNNKKVARYIVALKPNTLYLEGDGTSKNPYQIR